MPGFRLMFQGNGYRSCHHDHCIAFSGHRNCRAAGRAFPFALQRDPCRTGHPDRRRGDLFPSDRADRRAQPRGRGDPRPADPLQRVHLCPAADAAVSGHAGDEPAAHAGRLGADPGDGGSGGGGGHGLRGLRAVLDIGAAAWRLHADRGNRLHHRPLCRRGDLPLDLGAQAAGADHRGRKPAERRRGDRAVRPVHGLRDAGRARSVAATGAVAVSDADRGGRLHRLAGRAAGGLGHGAVRPIRACRGLDLGGAALPCLHRGRTKRGRIGRDRGGGGGADAEPDGAGAPSAAGLDQPARGLGPSGALGRGADLRAGRAADPALDGRGAPDRHRADRCGDRRRSCRACGDAVRLSAASQPNGTVAGGRAPLSLRDPVGRTARGGDAGPCPCGNRKLPRADRGQAPRGDSGHGVHAVHADRAGLHPAMDHFPAGARQAHAD